MVPNTFMDDLIRENEVYKVYLKDNILCGEYKKNTHIDLQMAKDLILLSKSLSKGVSYPHLIDAKHIISLSKDAREYLASPEATQDVIAGAFIIGSAVNRIIGNFFLRINKPQKPTKLFTDKEQALLWLDQYMRPQS